MAPIRLKFENRGLWRRQWVAYLEKDGSQWLVFAPGQHFCSVMHVVRYYAKVLNHA